MNKNNQLISIVMVTHDRIDLLQRAVNSVLAQRFQEFELVLIDNNSTVPIKALKILQDNRIHIYRTSEYLSESKSRNIGISKAKGQYICFLDDDDYYYPKKLKNQISYLEKNKDIDLVYSDVKQLNQNENLICMQGGPFSVKGMFRYRIIHPNSCLIRRKVLEDLKFDEKMTLCSDQDLLFQIALKYQVAYLPGIVGVWNRDNRPDQLTNRNFQRSYINWKMLCEKFAEQIRRYPEVRRYYFGKLAALSLLNGDVLSSVQSIVKCLKK